MRFFLQKILYSFIFILFVIIGIIETINITRTRFIHVEPNTHIAFFGNSHIETSINDTIVQNSINWARSADFPELIYAKVKLLKIYNPQIDSVYIGFDNVLGFHDNNFPYQNFHPFYYDQYDFEDWLNIFELSSYDRWINIFRYPFSWSKLKDIDLIFNKNITLKDCRDLGGYLYLTRDKLEERIALQKPYPQGKNKCNKSALYFFNKTIEFCNNNNIKVFFICAPQHHSALYDLESYKNEYKKHYSYIPFLDYLHLELADSCFADINHLNYKGAIIFSELLNQNINN